MNTSYTSNNNGRKGLVSGKASRLVESESSFNIVSFIIWATIGLGIVAAVVTVF